ncbi:MAG: PIN domain-containing protein [Acidobacteriaceae bacterium]
MPHRKPDCRVFLDANVLFSAAYREPAGLAVLWKLRGVQLLTSEYAAQEAANNLAEAEQQSRLRDLIERIEIVSDALGVDATIQDKLAGIDLPDKDRPILTAAVAANADFLLTGDIQHFGRYFGQVLCGVRILRPAEFLKSLAD